MMAMMVSARQKSHTRPGAVAGGSLCRWSGQASVQVSVQMQPAVGKSQEGPAGGSGRRTVQVPGAEG